MSFKNFLSTRKAAHDARGDFIRLAVLDPNLPDASSWAEIQAYVERHHDYHSITEAGAELWKEYQTAERKARNA